MEQVSEPGLYCKSRFQVSAPRTGCVVRVCTVQFPLTGGPCTLRICPCRLMRCGPRRRVQQIWATKPKVEARRIRIAAFSLKGKKKGDTDHSRRCKPEEAIRRGVVGRLHVDAGRRFVHAGRLGSRCRRCDGSYGWCSPSKSDTTNRTSGVRRRNGDRGYHRMATTDLEYCGVHICYAGPLIKVGLEEWSKALAAVYCVEVHL